METPMSSLRPGPAVNRRHTPTALSLLGAALIAVLAGLATPAPAQPVTGPGHVAGLDLSTPETAARALVTFWAARDFVGVWLTFDPALQQRMGRAVIILDPDRVLGPEPYPDSHVGLLRRSGMLLPAWALTQERLITADTFPYVAALLRGAAFARLLPFDFDDPEVAIEPAPPAPDAPRNQARLTLGHGDAAVVLVMHRRADLWRLAHVEIAGRELPEIWQDPDR